MPKSGTIRHFACVHRGFVQIRVAKTPPKCKMETLSKEIKETREVWVEDVQLDPCGYFVDRGHYETKEITTKKEIPVITFTGGRVVAQVSPQMVIRRLRVGLREGKVVELSPKSLEKLIGRRETE